MLIRNLRAYIFEIFAVTHPPSVQVNNMWQAVKFIAYIYQLLQEPPTSAAHNVTNVDFPYTRWERELAGKMLTTWCNIYMYVYWSTT